MEYHSRLIRLAAYLSGSVEQLHTQRLIVHIHRHCKETKKTQLDHQRNKNNSFFFNQIINKTKQFVFLIRSCIIALAQKSQLPFNNAYIKHFHTEAHLVPLGANLLAVHVTLRVSSLELEINRIRKDIKSVRLFESILVTPRNWLIHNQQKTWNKNQTMTNQAFFFRSLDWSLYCKTSIWSSSAIRSIWTGSLSYFLHRTRRCLAPHSLAPCPRNDLARTFIALR